MGVLAGQLMPFTFMKEDGDPSFIMCTSVWFLFSMFIYYSASLAKLVLGQQFHGPIYWLLNIAWASYLSWIIWRLILRSDVAQDLD